MAQFLDENFLLKNETAKRLFFLVAKDLPIFDYHCHLSPKAIAEMSPSMTLRACGSRGIITNGGS